LEASFFQDGASPDWDACLAYLEQEHQEGQAADCFGPLAPELIRNLFQYTLSHLMKSGDLQRLSRITALWAYYEECLTLNEQCMVFVAQLFHQTGLYAMKMPSGQMPYLEELLASRYLNLNLRITLQNFALSYYIQQGALDKVQAALDTTLQEFGRQPYSYLPDIYRFSLMSFYGRLHTDELEKAIGHYRDVLRLQDQPEGLQTPTHWIGSLRVSLELRDLTAAAQTARKLENLQEASLVQYCLLPLAHYYILTEDYDQAETYLHQALQHGQLLKSQPHWCKARALQFWILARRRAFEGIRERYEEVSFRMRMEELSQSPGTAEQYWLCMIQSFYYFAQWKEGVLSEERLSRRIESVLGQEPFSRDKSFKLMACYLLEEFQTMGWRLSPRVENYLVHFQESVAPLRSLIWEISQQAASTPLG
jgi:tetratricopeptide (TPR) repeat protein